MAAEHNSALRALASLTDRLHARGRLRVWSLAITVFGDAIAPRGGRVALGVLQGVMERLRVEPGALRTALSRLARDGWVRREKQGRNSFFSLDARGRHAFDLATRRIYAGGSPDWEGGWTVAIAPPGETVDADEFAALGFVRVNGGVYLRPVTANSSQSGDAFSDMLIIHGNSAEHPEAFRALWPSDEIATAYKGFVSAFRPLLMALEGGAALSPPDAMAARTLLIHDWRRIALRDPGLPRALLPDDWLGEEARMLARGIYMALSASSETWLDAAGVPQQTHPERFAARFEL